MSSINILLPIFLNKRCLVEKKWVGLVTGNRDVFARPNYAGNGVSSTSVF